jgi:hypothetical protein
MRPKRPTGTWPPRERSSTALAPRTGGAVQILHIAGGLLGARGATPAAAAWRLAASKRKAPLRSRRG